MQKTILLFFLCYLPLISVGQKDILRANTRAELVENLDSAMRSTYFITLSDAEKILEKPVLLKDTTYKFSSGVLRYSFNYVAKFVDSTSKGRLYFNFEQYKDTALAKNNFSFIKSENQKTGNVSEIKDLGDDAFLLKDDLNQPFIIGIKNNKIYKFRVLYLTTENSLNELLRTVKNVMSKS